MHAVFIPSFWHFCFLVQANSTRKVGVNTLFCSSEIIAIFEFRGSLFSYENLLPVNLIGYNKKLKDFSGNL